MGKHPPAFQFYAEDFYAGTIMLNCEELGAYIRLLCIQWTKGQVPTDMDRLRRITGTSDEVIKSVLAEYFKHRGRSWQNERLEEVRRIQQERSKAGSKGGSKTQANRQANGKANSNPSTSSSSSSSRRIESIDVDRDLAEIEETRQMILRWLPPPNDTDEKIAWQAAVLVGVGDYPMNWLVDSLEAVKSGKRKKTPWAYFLKCLRSKAEKSGRDFDADRERCPERT